VQHGENAGIKGLLNLHKISKRFSHHKRPQVV